jgi:aminoacylase
MEKDTAVEKLLIVLKKFYEYRETQMKVLEEDSLNFAESTSVNATIINGGLQINVVPAEISISFDVRLGININHDEFEKTIRDWCDQAGGDIELIFTKKDPYVEPTKTDESNLYWMRMREAIEEM